MASNDPYMRDRNVRMAVGMQVVGGTALGAGLGAAIATWFTLPVVIAVIVGAVIGFLLANVAVTFYGGRASR